MKDTAAAYDCIARQYAEKWFSDYSLANVLDEFISLLPQCGAVLDVGCGPGRDVKAMSSRGIAAIGIDVSSAVVREARGRVPNRPFYTMNMIDLDFDQDSFVGVWVAASLQHLPRKAVPVALSEFSRVLSCGGVLYVTVEEGSGEVIDQLGRFRAYYSLDSFLELLQGADFEVLRQWKAYGEKSTLDTPRPKRWLEFICRRS